MSLNTGFANELDLIKAINNKPYTSLNANLQHFCIDLFENNIDTTPLIATKIKGNSKPDIMITNKNITKYVSIKKGGGNSVHQEKITVFIKYLQDIGVSKTSINNLLLFHYGDDTTNDTGKIRYTARECETRYKEEIKSLNLELNSQKILFDILDRVLFTGNVENSQTVDFIYHGDLKKGLWASRDEIYKYFLRNTFKSKTVHFASLTYQVWGRNEKRTAVHPERRYIMQVKWSQILNDFENIKDIR